MGPVHGRIERVSVIYLLTATEAEARAAPLAALRGLNSGVNGVKIFVTGIGPQATASAMQAVAEGASADKPRAIVVAGTCGALAAGLREGAVVTYSECLFDGLASAERVTPDAELTGRMASVLRQCGIECQSITGVTSPKAAATRQEKNRLAATGASVVDMESYVILSAARQMAVPAVVLRAVSDGADREFPDFTRSITLEGGVNRLVAAAIASAAPLATVRLILAQRRALRRLSLALETVLGSGNWPGAS